MKYKTICLLVFLSLHAVVSTAQQTEKERIDAVLTQWHLAAAEASFDTY